MSADRLISVEEIASPEHRSIAIGPFGSSMKSEVYTDSGVPVVRGKDIHSGSGLRFVDPVYVSPDFADDSPAWVAERDDLVFPHRGAIGRVGIVDVDQVVLSTSMMKLRVDTERFDPKFVFYFFRGLGHHQLVANASTVGTPGIAQPLATLRSVMIPNLRLSTQTGIAEVLGALDDKIAANERLSGAVQDLLQERFALLRLDSFTGDGSFLTVSDLFEVNPRTSQRLAGQAPYLGMKDLPDSSMTVGSWSTREAKSGARFINGDVLLARITPCLENGKAGYVDFLENAEVGVGSTEFIVFRARSPLLSAVPFFLTKSERFRDFAIKHMQGTSGRQRLAAADVADYRLAKVNDESLNRFGELSLNLLKRVKTAVSESRALARTRDELLPLLMSGKITVKDAEAVVSDAV